MWTAVIQAPRQADLTRRARPEPGYGQVRVRLEGCGVCGSNLAVWKGQPWFSYPLDAGAPGHEGWGVVDAVGDGVDIAKGTRVACLSGHAFAEYDICDATQTVPLPSSLDDAPFPGEPLACAMNVVRRAAIEPGQTVAVVGVGFLGAMVTRLARARGAEVMAISRRHFARDVALRQGASTVVALTDTDTTTAEALATSGSEGFPVVVEAAGTQLSLDVASRLTAVRGRLVVAGYHQDGPRQVDMQSWNWRGIDVINAHERDPQVYVDGMRAAVDAVSDGTLTLDDLFTHSFELDGLDRALTLLEDRPEGFLKALVRV